MRFVVMLLAALCGLFGTAFAAPLDGALQTELLSLYDRYNKHLAAGRMKEAMAALETTPPADRLEALRKIRDLYRQLVGEEFARLRKLREEGGDPNRPPKQQ